MCLDTCLLQEHFVGQGTPPLAALLQTLSPEPSTSHKPPQPTRSGHVARGADVQLDATSEQKGATDPRWLGEPPLSFVVFSPTQALRLFVAHAKASGEHLAVGAVDVPLGQLVTVSTRFRIRTYVAMVFFIGRVSEARKSSAFMIILMINGLRPRV